MEEFFTNTFSTSLLCGIIFVVAAAIMYLFPPKRINYLYGYRTASSMKSQERWDFAQRFSTLQMVRGSVAVIAISLLGYFIPFSVGVKFGIGIALIALLVVYMFTTTEKAIKKQFTDAPKS